MTPLDIVLLAPGMAFQGDTLEKKALGGSETAALCMARELAKLGHKVRVFSNCEQPGEYDKVIYMPVASWSQYSQAVPHDINIVQRTPEAFNSHLQSHLNLLWCHDLALGRQVAQFRGVVWNIDQVMVLSQFMAAQYKQVYGLSDDVLWVTRNGIERARLNAVVANKVVVDGPGIVAKERDRKKLIYAARPERGLDILLSTIFPQLLKRDSNLRLYVCGYDNTMPHMKEFYGQIDQMIAAFGERVVWLGYLTKGQLYAQYLTAGCYVYPTPSPIMPAFAEISCISAMEAQACGLPIVTSKRGALPETIVDGAGTLIDAPSTNLEYHQQFCEAVMRYVTDDQAWQAASQAGLAHAQTLDWSAVAQQWDARFTTLLEERNRDRHRLAVHFIRRSDIVAARATLPDLDADAAADVQTRLAPWRYMDEEDGYRTQYEKIGQTHAPDFDAETGQQRFQACAEWMGGHRADIHRILDYGCAHGAYTVGFSNHFADVTLLGIDIDKHGITWANKFRAERALYPTNVEFRQGDSNIDLSTDPPFDLLFLGETLEHLPQPWEVVDKLERWVHPGGYVLATVPYGPWEYLSYEAYPYRAHIWEFDFHDLREMLGEKTDFQIHTLPLMLEPRTGEALGWHLLTWQVSEAKCHPIDMARKLRLQRPRETVSALVVAGAGAEDQMRWCLKSLTDVVDEIVIGDTGMNPEGLRIAKQFKARIVPARNPIEHGFEAPRNDALAACRMDWVLWIDTDEKLVDPEKIQKYLRANLYNGYSIRQHHFACDTTFKADLPVRMFRRAPLDGKTMRFYGMIHEHPELGLNDGPGVTIILADTHIFHTGYECETTRRRRFQRNYPLLQRDIQTYPDRILQKHFIARDNMLLAGYELQQNGGKVTPAVAQRCQETIEIWRQHFRGKPSYMNSDTLGYASDANKILNQGFDFKFELAAGRDSTPINGSGPVTYRFATMDDLLAELEWRAKTTAEPFVNVYW